MLFHTVQKHLTQSLIPRTAYHPIPSFADRAEWAALPKEIKAYYAGLSASLVKTDLLEPLPAVRYMDFARNGNRTNYERIHFARRGNLLSLAVSECIKGDGALLDDIINLIWSICEETHWVIPAHNSHRGNNGALPNIEAPMNIDLFSAETASTLAWVYYLLHDELDKQSPLVTRRIELELSRRIFEPYLADKSFWWMGFNNPIVNNWNPWINSSILNAALLVEQDESKRQSIVLRSAESAQKFIDVYFPDGGCDEGPSYFTVAAAALFDYLEALALATNGAVNIYDNPLIQNMARYIYRVHVTGDIFVNFADAPPHVHVPGGLLMRVGKAIGDETLYLFAQHQQARGFTGVPYAVSHSCDLRSLRNLFTYVDVQPADAPYAAPKEHYFEGIQVMTARQSTDSSEGFFLCCKGGHNAESHNHNDVGSFVLYRDGIPVIVDAGVESYTKKTFSDDRYSIWTMRSDYHNLPDINGATQQNADTFAARNVHYNTENNSPIFTMDIAGAYPAEAQVEQYTREFRFDRAAKVITMTDSYRLAASVSPLVMHLMFADEPTIATGTLTINGVTIRYDEAQFNAVLETIPLIDVKIRHDWQRDALYRVFFTSKKLVTEGCFTFTYEG